MLIIASEHIGIFHRDFWLSTTAWNRGSRILLISLLGFFAYSVSLYCFGFRKIDLSAPNKRVSSRWYSTMTLINLYNYWVVIFSMSILQKENKFRVIRGLKNLHLNGVRTVATIGSFDGIHLGHQTVLKDLKDQSQNLRVPLSSGHIWTSASRVLFRWASTRKVDEV